MMRRLYSTTLRDVGSETPELLAQGVLILFAAGAPAELAEVSVLHEASAPPGAAPVAGDALHIGDAAFRITAVGATAWAKVVELGHVVFSFTGAAAAGRPGEICVAPRPDVNLADLLVPGTTLAIVAAA